MRTSLIISFFAATGILMLTIFAIAPASAPQHRENGEKMNTAPSVWVQQSTNTITKVGKDFLEPRTDLKVVISGVPYIHETPDHVWTGPWKNACEEASIAMVENFYKGKSVVSIDEQKRFMTMLFGVEDRLWGQNANSDAAHTTELINGYTSFRATVKENPTAEDIKQEIRAHRPVISLHYGFDLHNRNIPFLATGSAYHMMVVIGYDDVMSEFVVHDDGDRVDGANHRYRYDVFMNSIHDYNAAEKKTNGPARVIFTAKESVDE